MGLELETLVGKHIKDFKLSDVEELMSSLESLEDVYDWESFQMKNLVGKANSLLEIKSHLFDDDLLKKLIGLNLQGIVFVDQTLGDEHESKNLLMWKGYLYSNIGNISRLLFRRTGERDYMACAFEFSIASAKLLREIEPRHAFYTFGYASEDAKCLSKITEDEIDWLKKAFNYAKIAGDMGEEYDVKHTIRCYENAMFRAEDLNKLTLNLSTGNSSWLEREYEAGLLISGLLEKFDLTEEFDPGFSDWVLKRTASIAEELSKLRKGKRILWTSRWFDLEKKIMRGINNTNVNEWWSNLKFFSLAGQNLFRICNNRKIVCELIKGYDKFIETYKDDESAIDFVVDAEEEKYYLELFN